jgi:D-alanyl-D-alanine carboxypeptidase/D-alanyl-D-alanine-endopeptidase (penicillin-binding protein 4)
MRLRIIQSSLLLIIVLFLTSCASHPHAQMYTENPAFYSYSIVDINSGHVEETYASEVYSTPASCQKTITALLVLKSLGPNYRYDTQLYITKKQEALHNIVLSFSGDPTLSSDDLLTLLAPLKNTTVQGKIILDASVFQTPVHSNNIMLDDLGSYYAQPIWGINLDKNLMQVQVAATQLGKPARISLDLPYKINAHVTTTNDPSFVNIEWDRNILKASGTINPNDAFLTIPISPIDVEPYILKKIQPLLKTLRIHGKIEIIHEQNRLPRHLILINEHYSELLKEMIVPALKNSDNFVFDSLYLTLIQSQSPQAIQRWKEGDPIIKALLKQYFTLDAKQALFVDGSGLSRYNRIQSKQFVEILRQGFSTPEFVAALPQRTENLPSLAKQPSPASHIRAKTGHMSGINCLCGYSLQSNKPKVFVIMATNSIPPAQASFTVLDKFVKEQVV